MSTSDKHSELLSVMLFPSHVFFCGFGGSKRLAISRIKLVGRGWDLLLLRLVQDSTEQSRNTWQKPRESAMHRWMHI